jgi:hypothetical protein
VEIWMRTRGRPRELDYQFVGEEPADSWWRAYRPVTDVERPTILLRSDGKSWSAYIAGIRSGRLDATENHIQVNLVLAGDCGQDENALALSIIRRSAAGLAQEKGQFIPGAPLGDRLPADEVERMLTSPGRKTAAAAADAVRAAYGEEAPASDGWPSEASRTADDWLGGLVDPDAQEAFGTLAAQLLSGSRGCAAALNLVEDEADLTELPRWTGPLGVLASRPGPQLWKAVRALGKAEAPQEPSRSKHRAPAPRKWRKLVMIIAGALVVVALAVLIGWLVRDLSR